MKAIQLYKLTWAALWTTITISSSVQGFGNVTNLKGYGLTWFPFTRGLVYTGCRWDFCWLEVNSCRVTKSEEGLSVSDAVGDAVGCWAYIFGSSFSL